MANKKITSQPAPVPSRRVIGGSSQRSPQRTILQGGYGWGYNHAPPDGDQAKNAAWWQSRATRYDAPLSSSGENLYTRQAVKREVQRELDKNRISSFSADFSNVYHGGDNSSLSKKPKITAVTFGEFETEINIVNQIVPNIKKKVSFTATHNNVSYRGEQLTPFTAFSSSVTSGYRATLESAGINNIDFTNFHKDSVLSYGSDTPMQGPFTERFVGGIQARHNAPLKSTDRKEAYDLVIGSGAGTISSLTAESVPKGQYTRGAGPKAPVNIQNIQTLTSSDGVAQVGNYSRNYEVVQGNDRSKTNIDFIFNNSNYAYSAPSAFLTTPEMISLNVTGSSDYPAPRQVSTRRINKTIIASRFAAPGSKVDSKQQFRDVNSDQLSPNNALSFRNIPVRRSYHDKLSTHTGFGGTLGDSEVLIQPYQTQRNQTHRIVVNGTSPVTLVTGTVYDNSFVSRPIPAGDSTQWFMGLSGSDTSIYNDYILSGNRYPDNISLPVTYLAANPFGSSMKLSTNSQYSFIWVHSLPDVSPWTQTRASNLSEAKYFRNNNIYQFDPEIVSDKESGKFSETTRSRTHTDQADNLITSAYSKSYREPFITSRYKPLTHTIRTPIGTPEEDFDNDSTINMRYSYGNTMMGFAHRELNRKVGGSLRYYQGKINRPYEVLRDYSSDPQSRRLNGIETIKMFEYPEVIYPREVNTYLSGSRSRLSYRNNFWKDDIEIRSFQEASAVVGTITEFSGLLDDATQKKYMRIVRRLQSPGVTSQGHIIQNIEQTPYNPTDSVPDGDGKISRWPLDSFGWQDYNNTLVTVLTASTPVALADASTMACGELMMTHYGTVEDTITGPPGKILGSASYVTSSVNSAQYVYNVPVMRPSFFSIGGIYPDGTITAVETNASILNGQTMLIAFDVDPSTGAAMRAAFQFDMTRAPSNPGFDSSTGVYLIGVGTGFGGTTSGVATAIHNAISYAASVTGLTLSSTAPSSANLAVEATVFTTGLNGSAVATGGYISGGHGTSGNFSGGAAATPQQGAYLPEPRSVGSAYSRPPWTAHTVRRFVDGEQKGTTGSVGFDSNPFYDTYEKYAESIRLVGKDHTIIPEFRISEHVENYSTNGSPFELVSSTLEITGANSDISDGSSPLFYERFSISDNIEFLQDFMSHDSGDVNHIFNKFPRHFQIESKAVLKLLPYDGFYPVNRTLQLAELFSSSYAPTAQYTGLSASLPEAWRSLLRPFYAPGIVYNSIKAGIAVDYPVRRGDKNSDQYLVVSGSQYENVSSLEFACLTGSLSSTAQGNIPSSKRRGNRTFDWSSADVNKFFWADRLPFETIMAPEALINENSDPVVLSDMSSFLYRDASGSFNTKALDGSLYKKAISNFLANVPRFFLSKKTNKFGSSGYLTKFVSQFGDAPKSSQQVADPERTVKVDPKSAYMMEVGLLKTENYNLYDNPYAYGIPTATGSSGWNNKDFQPSGNSWPKHRAEFAPFAPPHYYGTSGVRIVFMPNGAKEEYTLNEILNNDDSEIFVTYFNDSGSYYDATSGSFVSRDDGNQRYLTTTNTPEYGWNRAWQNRMDLDASVNLSNIFPMGGNATYRSNDPNKWTIMTKWECPNLDFPFYYSDGGTEYNMSSSVASGEFYAETQGMWHQYGVMPDENQGAYLYIKDIPTGEDEEYDLAAIVGSTSGGDITGSYEYVKKTPRFVVDSGRQVKSLADLCGFDPDEIIRKGMDLSKAKRIGELADDKEKTLSEAILALPFFLDKNGTPKLITLQAPPDKLGPKIKEFRKSFTKFSLPPSLAQKLIGMVPKGYPNIPDTINPFGPDDYDSVLDGSDIKQIPVVYLMEHKVSLTRQDLADIWQGVMPDLSTRLQISFSSIDHYMPGDNVETSPTKFPEILQQQINLGVPRDGHPRYDLLDIAEEDCSQGFVPDIKWLVFKVKEKGIGSYAQFIAEEVDGPSARSYDKVKELLSLQGLPTSEVNTLLGDRDEYSKNLYMSNHSVNSPTYNWPYDYCSLVELGKIETKVGFRPDLEKEYTEAIESSKHHDANQAMANAVAEIARSEIGALVTEAGEINKDALTQGNKNFDDS